MIFHDVSFLVNGERHTHHVWNTAELIRPPVEMFWMMFQHFGNQFHVPIPHPRYSGVELQWWRFGETAASATFWIGEEPGRMLVLTAATDALGDYALKILQTVVVRSTYDTPMEPAFEIMNLEERPALAKLEFWNGRLNQPDYDLLGDLDVLLATAFFLSVSVDARREG